MRTRTSGFIVAFGVALLTAPPAAAATPPATPAFGVHPALSGQTTLSKNHFAYAVPQDGGTVHDAVVVSNYSDAPLSFDVHGADMVTAQGGGFAPAAEGARSTQVGAWVSVAQAQITVPPHGDASDAFSIAVPAGRPPGEYLGAVVVARHPDAATGVRVVTRAALTVDVTVVGTLSLRVVADPLSAEQQRNEEHFTVTVSNPGNVLVTVSGDITVRDGGGRTLATLPVSPSNLYVIPGGRTQMTAVWKGVPMWGSATATATLIAHTASGASGTFHSAELHLGFFAWALVIAPVAGVLAALLAWWEITRQRRRVPAAAR